MADCGVSKGSAKAEQIEWDGGVENGRGVHGSTEAYDSITTSCSRACLRCAGRI